MPKNKYGGNKHKKQKNHAPQNIKRELRKADATKGEIYGIILKRMGNRRVLIGCQDKKRSGLIPGKMWKKMWLNVDNVVLCERSALSTTDDDVCTVCYKYTPEEVVVLKRMGFIDFLNLDVHPNDTLEEPTEETTSPNITLQGYNPSLDDLDFSSESSDESSDGSSDGSSDDSSDEWDDELDAL